VGGTLIICRWVQTYVPSTLLWDWAKSDGT